MFEHGTFIENEIYKITISKDHAFTLDSADNKPYKRIYNPCNMKRTDYYKVFSIGIDDGNSQKDIALIGSVYGADCGVAVLAGNDLIVLMNTMLAVIDCENLSIKSHKMLPKFGIYFSIDRFEDGYIIYGELDILKLSYDLEIEWSFSGGDIFISQDGSVPFSVENDVIHLIDWNGTHYRIDKFGKEIPEGAL